MKYILFMLTILFSTSSFAATTMFRYNGYTKNVPVRVVKQKQQLTSNYLRTVLHSFSCTDVKISGSFGTANCGNQIYSIIIAQRVTGSWGWGIDMFHKIRFFQLVDNKMEIVFEEELRYF